MNPSPNRNQNQGDKSKKSRTQQPFKNGEHYARNRDRTLEVPTEKNPRIYNTSRTTKEINTC